MRESDKGSEHRDSFWLDSIVNQQNTGSKVREGRGGEEERLVESLLFAAPSKAENAGGIKKDEVEMEKGR